MKNNIVFDFFDNISNLEEKTVLAKKIASFAKSGDVIGAGSGSSSYLALIELSKRIKNEGLDILVIPTSIEIEIYCNLNNIKTTTIISNKPDWCFDGADEISKNNIMIKGRGGALLREKLVMELSNKTYILADKSKFVDNLGEKFYIPIEIIPSALFLVEKELNKFENIRDVKIRKATGKDGPIITENGNLILDIKAFNIDLEFNKSLKNIPGVVETGIFYKKNVIFI